MQISICRFPYTDTGANFTFLLPMSLVVHINLIAADVQHAYGQQKCDSSFGRDVKT